MEQNNKETKINLRRPGYDAVREITRKLEQVAMEALADGMPSNAVLGAVEILRLQLETAATDAFRRANAQPQPSPKRN